MRALAAGLIVLVAVAPAFANTYKVTTTSDTGLGSLRQAIGDANSHLGPDRIIFASALSGSTIALASPLPPLKNAGTTINGDTNNDGKPNIGVFLGGAGHGGAAVTVKGADCSVTGLAVGALLNGWGIEIYKANGCKVQGCHVGVSLDGSTIQGVGGVALVSATHCLVGGSTAAERNVLAPTLGLYSAAVLLLDGSNNVISGNHIGLSRGGGQTLGTAGYGVMCLSEGGFCTQNRIGGTAAGEGNRFGGLACGVLMSGAVLTDNTILGNTFGLLANGKEAAPLTEAGVLLSGPDLPGSITLNTIGGTTAAARNVFANVPVGVRVSGAGTQDNRIQGNWFGSNLAGNSPRPLTKGVELLDKARRQTIGGTKASAGNYFTPNAERGIYTYGLAASAGNGSTIGYNSFGQLAHGTGTGGTCGVALLAVSAQITRNTFHGGRIGVNVSGAGADPGIYGNTFDGCLTGVDIVGEGDCSLGDLGNSSTRDDGGNVFIPPLFIHNSFAIRNDSAGSIKAEGNDFGTQTKAYIEARIWDKLDDATLGRVDFDPLTGGVHPSGGTVQVTAATTVPSGQGAEIAFALSAPAEVTLRVLNAAGRVVAQPLRDVSCTAGTQRVVWNGRDATGLRVPSGRYLIRIEARAADGAQSAALCSLLHRG